MRRRPVRIDVSDEELDAALALAKEFAPHDPRVVKAQYRPKEDAIYLDFADGRTLSIPRRLLQGLGNAKPTDLSSIEIAGGGTGLHRPSLDVDHYVLGLLGGVFGTARWMREIGRRGGLVRSKAKASAARRNGLKGGRPRRTIFHRS